MAQARQRPNILVTGTPGTGKTTTSSLLADDTSLRHVNVGDLVRDKSLRDGWHDELHCHVVNEDLWILAERWFDYVVVLQTDNSIPYDTLASRGYTGSKLSIYIECEIFQVLLEEAKSSYAADIVVPLQSDSVDDISRNLVTIADWIRNWQPRTQLPSS